MVEVEIRSERLLYKGQFEKVLPDKSLRQRVLKDIYNVVGYGC